MNSERRVEERRSARLKDTRSLALDSVSAALLIHQLQTFTFRSSFLHHRVRGVLTFLLLYLYLLDSDGLFPSAIFKRNGVLAPLGCTSLAS